MDVLLLMAAHAACVIALIFACKSPAAGFIMHAFGWTAGLYLSGWFVVLGLDIDAMSPTRWTGTAETGPATLLVMVLAMASPFIVGWERARGE